MSTAEPAQAEPWPIGGWLILVAIGVVLGPLREGSYLFSLFQPLFQDGIYEAFTTPGSANFHPLWKGLIWAEISINLALLIAGLWLIYLMFAKKTLFKTVYTGLVAFSLVFILADAYAVTLVLPDTPVFDEETNTQLGRSLLTLCIWVPYLWLSERSKHTFTL